MKIYDCFTFYNEFDLLELRLQEHWDSVDKFIIAEANKTHAGRPKEFLLEQNWDRYKDYADKIVHIKEDDMPTHDNAWVLENFQRNALARGLQEAQGDDLVVISDVDEIIRAESFDVMRDTDYKVYSSRSPMFYFKLNYMAIEPNPYLINSMAVRAGFKLDPQTIRNMVHRFAPLPHDYSDADSYVIQHSGWHFTYFGNSEHAANKLRNFAHQESVGLADGLDIDKLVAMRKGTNPNNPGERFEIVEVDDYFPETILKNMDRWKDFILPGAEHTVKDFLPGLED